MSHGIRMSTMPNLANLLEELRAAYQGLRPTERQQVKNVLRTLAERMSDAPRSELIQHRRITQWKQLDC